MTETPENQQRQPEEQAKPQLNLPADKPSQTIISYYRDDMGNVGGLKVKWSVRVIAGPGAAKWDARQAEAIREALEWIRKHPAT